jgi:hypothetical protein
MYGYAHPALPAYVGTNGLSTLPPQSGMVLAQPSSGLSMADVEAWMEKETLSGVKNKWLALAGGALAVGALGYYGHKKRWF